MIYGSPEKPSAGQPAGALCGAPAGAAELASSVAEGQTLRVDSGKTDTLGLMGNAAA